MKGAPYRINEIWRTREGWEARRLQRRRRGAWRREESCFMGTRGSRRGSASARSHRGTECRHFVTYNYKF